MPEILNFKKNKKVVFLQQERSKLTQLFEIFKICKY